MIRVTTGFLKGMNLAAPRHIRPTEGKVRQALFNILQARIEDARVLDGFAGSGSLGIEALSRGAREVVFIEQDPLSVRAIQQNLAKIRPGTVPGSWYVIRADAVQAIRAQAARLGVFDLILLDPPYGDPAGTRALRAVADCAILGPAGVLSLEHASVSQCDGSVGSLTLVGQHRYGKTVLSFYAPTPETGTSAQPAPS